MGSHGILGVSPKGFNYDVLLYPFVHLNVPPMSVQAGDLGCADVEVVRDKHDFFPSLFVIEADSAYRFRIEINRLGCQTDCEITRDARFLVCFRQFPMAEDFILHVILRPAYPIGTGYMEAEQSIEVNIRLVHHVEGIWLRFEDVQLVAVVPPAMCDMDVGRNAASEIQKGCASSLLPCYISPVPTSPT